MLLGIDSNAGMSAVGHANTSPQIAMHVFAIAVLPAGEKWTSVGFVSTTHTGEQHEIGIRDITDGIANAPLIASAVCTNTGVAGELVIEPIAPVGTPGRTYCVAVRTITDGGRLYRASQGGASRFSNTTMAVPLEATFDDSTTTLGQRYAIFANSEASGSTITDVNTDDQIEEGEQDNVIAGTGFGASQGSGGVDIDGVPVSVDSWGDTSIQFDHAADANKYGPQVLTVTASSAQTATRNVAINPPAGTSFIDVSNVDNAVISASPAIEAGDQVRYDSTTDSGNWGVEFDGNLLLTLTQLDADDDPAGETFAYSVWDPDTKDWGAEIVVTLNGAGEVVSTTAVNTLSVSGGNVYVGPDELPQNTPVYLSPQGILTTTPNGPPLAPAGLQVSEGSLYEVATGAEFAAPAVLYLSPRGYLTTAPNGRPVCRVK